MQIEGKNAVREALRAGTTIEKLTIIKGASDRDSASVIALAREKGVKVVFVDKNVLDKESVTGRHQGMIAVVSDFTYSTLEDIVNDENPLIIVLDGVEDPHNLGSVIRVAECAGASGIVIGKHRSCQVNETVVRVSAGATQHVKIAKVTNINYAIEYLKEKNIWVYSADMDGESIYDTDLTGPCALVIGGEGDGVHQTTRKLCDGIVSLPMFGKVNSLNASVATGIAVYEVIRQRMKK